MPKFRKKPVVIEAFQWTGDENQRDDPEWVVNAMKQGTVWVQPAGTGVYTLEIRTLEGQMAALPGDFVIQGIKGEIYPCKPDIFSATYESAE